MNDFSWIYQTAEALEQTTIPKPGESGTSREIQYLRPANLEQNLDPSTKRSI